MTKALLNVRLRALFSMFLQRGAKSKKKSIGNIILFSFAFLYLGAAMCGMSGFTFYSLLTPYHALGLDWLYFSMAGLGGLGIAVIGSVFTTQNQLYEARDNDLLLSMPIPPSRILMSRMIPLLGMNMIFASIVMLPAFVVYAIWASLSPIKLLLQILSIPAVALLAQAIACILGWLLHLLMSRINRSLASVIFVIAFLAVYYPLAFESNKILNSLLTNSEDLAQIISSWIWPFFALGKACDGSIAHYLAFAGIFIAIFALAYWVLSRFFIQSATAAHSGRKQKALSIESLKYNSPSAAIIRKELGKFISSPVYLTNMGLGIILTIGLTVAGIVMKNDVMDILNGMFLPESFKPLIICSILAFLVSTMCISTPSVSLEGKNLWILKAMPLSGKEILQAKLGAHILLTVPVSCLAGLILAMIYNCDAVGCLLSALIPALLAVFSGLLGMVTGLKWAQFDYINDAYPCKQSVSVLVSMFGMMSIPFALGILYFNILADHITPNNFLILTALLLSLLIFGFYKLMTQWGVKKWNSF